MVEGCRELFDIIPLSCRLWAGPVGMDLDGRLRACASIAGTMAGSACDRLPTHQALYMFKIFLFHFHVSQSDSFILSDSSETLSRGDKHYSRENHSVNRNYHKSSQ